MTRDEAKQTVADDHGFTNWHHMIEYLQMSGEITLLKIYIDEAMDNYANEKVYNIEQKLSACEIVLDETQDKLKHIHNKIMVQWEKDFGSIHNEQNMDAYTVSGFVRNILGTDRQTLDA